jgi:hypothetical protein
MFLFLIGVVIGLLLGRLIYATDKALQLNRLRQKQAVEDEIARRVAEAVRTNAKWANQPTTARPSGPAGW